MTGRTDTEGTVVERAGLRLAERDQFGDRVDRYRRIEDEAVIDGREPADRREVFQRIAQVREQRGICGKRNFGSDHQRGAVGRLVHHVFRRQLVVGAAAVLHHRRHAPVLVDVLAQRARQHVGHAAGRRRHHDGDRLRGEGLGVGGDGCCESRSNNSRDERDFHLSILPNPSVVPRWPRSGPRRMHGPGRRPSRLATLAPQGDGY